MTTADIHTYLDFVLRNIRHIEDSTLDHMHSKLAEELVDRGYLQEDLINKIKEIV